MSTSIKSEGIVLQAIPFQDYHLISTLFTKGLGVQKLICPYARARRSPFSGHLLPLNHLEFEFRKTGKDLGRLENASLIESHADLRNSLAMLEGGCQLLKAVSDSQLFEKPAPLLFDLLCKYLALLPEARSPAAIVASFRLKLLRHDGLIAPKEGGLNQVLFQSHFPPFSLEEHAYLWALTMTTSSALLKELSLPDALPKRIEELFDACARE